MVHDALNYLMIVSCTRFRITGNSGARGPFPVIVKQAHDILLHVETRYLSIFHPKTGYHINKNGCLDFLPRPDADVWLMKGRAFIDRQDEGNSKKGRIITILLHRKTRENDKYAQI